MEELEPGRRSWQVCGPPALAAVLFGLFGYAYAQTPLVLVLLSAFVLVLVQVIFFDLEHLMILDRVMYPAIAVALVASLFKQPWWAGLAAALGVGLALLLLGAAGSVIYKTDALGLGDVKLGVLVGLLLGPFTTVEALLLGFFAAGVVAIGIALIQRSLTGNIALGPFLAGGALVGLLHPLG